MKSTGDEVSEVAKLSTFNVAGLDQRIRGAVAAPPANRPRYLMRIGADLLFIARFTGVADSVSGSLAHQAHQAHQATGG